MEGISCSQTSGTTLVSLLGTEENHESLSKVFRNKKLFVVGAMQVVVEWRVTANSAWHSRDLKPSCVRYPAALLRSPHGPSETPSGTRDDDRRRNSTWSRQKADERAEVDCHGNFVKDRKRIKWHSSAGKVNTNIHAVYQRTWVWWDIFAPW
jgi:hypothetical protein